MAFSTSLPTSGWPFLRSGNGWTGQKRRLQYRVDQWRYCLLGSVTLVLSAPSHGGFGSIQLIGTVGRHNSNPGSGEVLDSAHSPPPSAGSKLFFRVSTVSVKLLGVGGETRGQVNRMMLAAILGSKGTLLDYPLWGKDIFISDIRIGSYQKDGKRPPSFPCLERVSTLNNSSTCKEHHRRQLIDQLDIKWLQNATLEQPQKTKRGWANDLSSRILDVSPCAPDKVPLNRGIIESSEAC
ncbi:predicted protein [Histoplasma capsulatum var. duboisii H88]|uniref:Predicted protein n=1 Tax=Ajellomyces capsulatus (strain H88) TaxID=544711 RepID=F0U9D5_AJEC8|nr:predicted protein [Histoplasma capsulatum var. duboisii H88]